MKWTITVSISPASTSQTISLQLDPSVTAGGLLQGQSNMNLLDLSPKPSRQREPGVTAGGLLPGQSKMNLLDFPPEVFQLIIHELVLDVGIAEAWRCYRPVCKTFATQIFYDTFRLQPLASIASEKAGNFIHTTRDNRRLLLLSRVKNPMDAHVFLPKRIQKMAKVLLRGAGGTKNVYMRASYTEKLCAAIEFRFDVSNDNFQWQGISLFSGSDLLRVLMYGKCSSYRRPQLVAKEQDIPLEHVAAAAATNNPALFRVLLSQVSTFTDGRRGLYRHPLQTAARFGYHKIIDELVQYERGNPPVPGRAEYVNDRQVHTAMYIAIYSHQADAITSLSKFYELPGIKVLSETYNTWILEAMRRNNDTVLDCILNIKTGPRLRLSREAFTIICERGDVELLDRVIEKGIAKLHRPYPQKDNHHGRRTCPLIVAVQSGKPEMVSSVLAIADVEGACKHIPNTMSPLVHAVTAYNSAMVKLLLEAGANIQCKCDYGFCSLQVALAIEDKAIYDILRAALLEQGHDFPAYEDASTSEGNYAVCFNL